LTKRFDLLAVRESLLAAGDKRRAKLIKQAVDAGSARTDLAAAKAKLEILLSLVRQGSPILHEEVQDDITANIAGSLFAHCILLYSAVSTNNDSRDKLDITKGWEPGALEAHGRIIFLRHQAVAHFGFTNSYADGVVSNDELLLVAHEGNVSVEHFAERTNYLAHSVGDLELCIQLALRSIELIIEDRLDKLNKELSTWRAHNPEELKRLLLACEINSDTAHISSFTRSFIPGGTEDVRHILHPANSRDDD
jgi:hypothetical protein